MRVALYAGVSTSDQDAELQLVELRRYAAASGWPIAGELYLYRHAEGWIVTEEFEGFYASL